MSTCVYNHTFRKVVYLKWSTLLDKILFNVRIDIPQFLQNALLLKPLLAIKS